MSSYAYRRELTIIQRLNEAAQGYPIKFMRTGRTTSAANLKKWKGVDFIKSSLKNTDFTLEIFLYKNFAADPTNKYLSYLRGIEAMIKKLIAQDKLDLGKAYHMETGDSKSLSAQRREAFADELKYADREEIPKELNQFAVGLAKAIGQTDSSVLKSIQDRYNLQTELTDNVDPEFRRSAEQLSKFVAATQSGRSILIPLRYWKSVGWSRVAAKAQLGYDQMDADTPLIAVDYKDLKGLLEGQGWEFTKTEQELAPHITKFTTSPAASQAREFSSRLSNAAVVTISDAERDLKRLANPAKYLLSMRKESEKREFSKEEKGRMRVLTMIVEQQDVNMLDLLKKKLRNQMASHQEEQSRKIKDSVADLKNEYDISTVAPENPSQAARRDAVAKTTELATKNVAQIERVGSYWIIKNINGVAISYSFR